MVWVGFWICSSHKLLNSLPGELAKLTLTTPMYRIAKAVAALNSGLDVKDRVWLKMTIPKSFIGKINAAPGNATSLGRVLSITGNVTLMGTVCNIYDPLSENPALPAF